MFLQSHGVSSWLCKMYFDALFWCIIPFCKARKTRRGFVKTQNVSISHRSTLHFNIWWKYQIEIVHIRIWNWIYNFNLKLLLRFSTCTISIWNCFAYKAFLILNQNYILLSYIQFQILKLLYFFAKARFARKLKL